jgi:hypothetical protein
MMTISATRSLTAGSESAALREPVSGTHGGAVTGVSPEPRLSWPPAAGRPSNVEKGSHRLADVPWGPALASGMFVRIPRPALNAAEPGSLEAAGPVRPRRPQGRSTGGIG